MSSLSDKQPIIALYFESETHLFSLHFLDLIAKIWVENRERKNRCYILQFTAYQILCNLLSILRCRSQAFLGRKPQSLSCFGRNIRNMLTIVHCNSFAKIFCRLNFFNFFSDVECSHKGFVLVNIIMSSHGRVQRGGQGVRTPLIKSRVIWVSIENKQLETSSGKNVGPPGTLGNHSFLRK